MHLVLLLVFTLSLIANERIVTLSPAIAEIVSSIDGVENIVGVSQYTVFPKELQSRPKVGGYFALSFEKVLAQRPTLVIGLPHQEAFLQKLHAFKIKTLTIKLSRLEEIKATINTIAAALHKEQKGQELISVIEQHEKEAPRLTRPKKVLIVFAASSILQKGVYVAGHDLYFEEVLHRCNATNAYSEEYTAQPVLTIEGVIATDPDTVLLLFGPLDDVDTEDVLKQWQELPIKAAKNGSIKVIQNNYILIPSQRVGETISTICKEIQ